MISRINLKKNCSITLAMVCLATVQTSVAKDPPISGKVYDFTKGDSLPAQASHDWTLGPTGARGWCQVGKSMTAGGNTTPSRQILITAVSEGSPADGVLKKGDVILGVGQERFDRDARITFAKALGAAQALDGKMVVQRFREGKTQAVTMVLPKLPAFSKTAPFQCEKSQMLLAQGCAALSKRGIGRPNIASDINALALLASGDEQYLEQITDYARQCASRTMSPERGLPCWHFAFRNIFLCEYYLKTNDTKVLAEIKHLTSHLVAGRGPLSTWGHSFVDPTNQRLRGYGAVNAVGVPVVMSIVLAKECGVRVKDLDLTISESAQFFRRHVGLGAIPYGDGPPTTRYGHDDNGKNSAAALFFNLLGDKVATKYYTRTAMAAYGSDREQGHTGNFFNMFWSLPAVALGGAESTGMWLNEFGWYYDLARDPSHRYRYQGYPNERSNSAHARWDSPGAYLLHFALAKKQLRITGRKPASITRFTTQENKDNISAGRLNYKGAKAEVLTKAMSSWSPVARARAEKEMRKRGMLAGLGFGLGSKDPLERVAAVKAITKFEDGVTMLGDKDLRVRLAAMKVINRLDKPRSLEAVFAHLVKAKKESPVFTQNVSDMYFPLGRRSAQIGKLLNAIGDRKLAVDGIKILLEDQDALVASRVAMGVGVIPKAEQEGLLTLIYDKAINPPEGNVMFVNGLRASCVEVLAKWKLQEGLDVALALLVEDSWGRNARLPRAAAVVSSYGGHAKPELPKIKSAHAKYAAQNNSKWAPVVKKVIDKVNQSPKANLKLKTLSSLPES